MIALLLLTACADRQELSITGALEVGSILRFSGDSALHDIRDVRSDEQGNVWVVSGTAPHLHHYSRDGSLLSQFGWPGEGPGELTNPWYLLAADDGSDIAVFDTRLLRLVEFSEDEGFVRETRLDVYPGFVVPEIRAGSYAEPLRPYEWESGYVVDIFDGQVVKPQHLWRGRLVQVDSAGSPTGDLLRFADLRKDPQLSGDVLFASAPLWTVCPTRSIAVLNPDAAELLVFEEGEWKSEPLYLPDRWLTEDDFRRAVDASIARDSRNLDPNSGEIRRLVRQALREYRAGLPRRAPPVRLRCDPHGRLWVQLFSTEHDFRGNGSSWIVLDGSMPKVVRFPDSFQPLWFGSASIVGVMRDAYDVESPASAAYPIELVRE